MILIRFGLHRVMFRVSGFGLGHSLDSLGLDLVNSVNSVNLVDSVNSPSQHSQWFGSDLELRVFGQQKSTAWFGSDCEAVQLTRSNRVNSVTLLAHSTFQREELVKLVL
ncbi:hypothetical protein Hanom_Chr06g00533511 [Helianthus anomalus]